MYIRRKIFSLLQDETGEERYFSTTNITLEDAEERIFSITEDEVSEKEFSDKKEVSLEDVKSHKGLKRALAAGLLGLDSGGGLVGGFVGKKAANKADKEGKSDEEILKAAKKEGRNAGGASAAGLGAAITLKNLKKIEKLSDSKLNNKAKLAIVGTSAAITGALGALGGKNAASVNTKDRLAKRSLKERENKKED